MEKKQIAIIGPGKENVLAQIAELGLNDEVEIVDVTNVTDFGKPMTEPYLITNPYPEIYDMRTMMDDDWNRIPKSDRRGTVAKVRNSKEDPKIQRNDPCPCGSGKKYKKCCGHE